jgi:hypothetical protein
MQTLNLPTYPFKIKLTNNKHQIFDEIRKKYVSLTPEEWVRQNFVKFLSVILGYPESIIGIEVSIKINGMPKRCDIIIFDKLGQPDILVECKAPEIIINQKTIEQAGIYDLKLKVRMAILTNGLSHYCLFFDNAENKFKLLNKIPSYTEFVN